MKKFASAAICIFFLIKCQCQALQDVDFDYVNKKMIFPAVIRPLTKDDHYIIEIPSSLSYYHDQLQIRDEIWNPFINNVVEIKAKLNTSKFDYRIVFKAAGITNITAQPAKRLSIEVPLPNGSSRPADGYVRDFTCNFVCNMLLYSGTGQLLATYPVTTAKDVFTVTFHKDFLTADNKPVNPKTAVPFLAEKQLMDAETMYHDLMARKMEQIVAYKVFQQAGLMVNMLFENYNTYKCEYGYGYIKTKKRLYDYADFDKYVASYLTAVDVMDKGDYATCVKICDTLEAQFKIMLTSKDARIDKNVQQAIHYNLAHLALLQGKIDDARKNFDDVVNSGVLPWAPMMATLALRIRTFNMYYSLKNIQDDAGKIEINS